MADQKERIKQIIDFLTVAEKLKSELRHSYTTDISRRESVAEHTWMASLLAILLAHELPKDLDQLRLIKMVIIHDLAEATVGDIPTFEVSDRQNDKYVNEERAMKEMAARLPQESADELLALWREMEDCQTTEAQIVRAIDKLEVNIQHDLADISTWEAGDYQATIGYKEEVYKADPVVKAFKEILNEISYAKIKMANQLHQLTDQQQAIARHGIDFKDE